MPERGSLAESDPEARNTGAVGHARGDAARTSASGAERSSTGAAGGLGASWARVNVPESGAQ